MNQSAAFASSFIPTTSNTIIQKKSSCQRSKLPDIVCQTKYSSKQSTMEDIMQVPIQMTRRTFVGACGALFGLSSVTHMERALALTNIQSPLQVLKGARVTVDTIDDLITNAKWDSVRTVLAKDPVNKTKDACNLLIDSSTQDNRGALVGLKEDALSSIKLLDTSVYANVFVGEDRQILGTKVDYDVPRTYLSDLKDALDALIDIAS